MDNMDFENRFVSPEYPDHNDEDVEFSLRP